MYNILTGLDLFVSNAKFEISIKVNSSQQH